MNPRTLAPTGWQDRPPSEDAGKVTLVRSWHLPSIYFCTIAFVLGILRPWTISLIGAMPLGELLMVAFLGPALVWTILTAQLPTVPSPRLMLALGITQLIALGSYVVSDFYRDSIPVDMLRGWLRMVFLAIDLLGFAILFGADSKAFAWHQLGYGFSFIHAAFIPPYFGDYWKFGFGYPLTMLLAMAAPYFAGRAGTIIALAGMGLVHEAMDFRSLGAACWLVGGLIALRYLPLRLRQTLLILGAVTAIAASPWIYWQTFYSEKGRANRSNVERGAMIQAAWEGFVESPLIGQGSWFSKSRVMDNFLLIRREISEETRNSVGFQHDDFGNATIHSQILVALAEGGLLGATFFVFYGLGILWALWYSLGEGPWSWLVPSRIMLFVAAFWDVLMSPFSGPVRLNIALVSVLIAVCWREKREAEAAIAEES